MPHTDSVTIAHISLDNIYRTYRYIAYRRFVLWIWHRLGRRNRKVLPACVVKVIRTKFPSDEYTGFRAAQREA
jgi:hypothetical protein